MCNVAAIFAHHYAALDVDRDELRRIRDSVSFRGPDGVGEWYSEGGRVALGHRRLAIIDLSDSGAQPMQSQDGKVVITFNGQIYNYGELRTELQKKGHVFRSHTDTEVLLHLYQEKGEAMVHELRGMFAFVLWDGTKDVMHLVRDPYGIKPLYYADDGWTIRVASQVKALLAGGKVSRVPEPAGIVGFFLMGSVPEPYTTYQEIRQVPAGSVISVSGLGPSSPKPYFSIARVFTEARERYPRDYDGEFFKSARWRDVVRETLLDSVRHHFVSDVPVGVFLSSGIDSGSLVRFACEIGVEDLRTVTLAFKEFSGDSRDEAPLAERMARLCGTKHHVRFLDVSEFEADLDRIFEVMDQPTIDGINLYFVSKAASEVGLKVALSGLGGDELFGGYPSFQEIPRLVDALRIPSRFPFSGDVFRHLYDFFSFRSSAISPKYAGLLKYGGSYAGAYLLRRGLFMPWELESVMDRQIALEGLKRLGPISYIGAHMDPDPKVSFARIGTLEASLYMRNQLLRDADWAGMAHSVEVRTPFVDAWLLKSLAPILISEHQAKATGATQVAGSRLNKRLLLECLHAPLPQEVVIRKKTGFTIPIDRWLERGKGLDGWRKVPSLARESCPWMRRWAYAVMERRNEPVLHEEAVVGEF